MIQVFRQISVNYIGIAAAQKLMYFPDRVLRAPFRSIPISIRVKICLEDRLQHQLGGSLDHSVPNCGDGQCKLHLSPAPLWDGLRSVILFTRFEANVSRS